MQKRTKQIAWGTALAAGIGYLAGILTAPKSGKETRSDIERTALRAKREAEKALKGLLSELNSLLKQAKKLQTKGEFKKAVSEAQTAKDKVRDLLSSLHEGETSNQDLQKAIEDVNAALDHLKKYLKKA